MGGDFYGIIGWDIAVNRGYHRGVLPVFGIENQLTNVAGSNFGYGNLVTERTDAFIGGEEVEEVFHPGPGR